MKQSVDFYVFREAFKAYNRLNHFPEGLRVLFEYLEELERDEGEELELDVIGLCGDFTEAKLSKVLREYSLDSYEDLTDATTVIDVDNDEDPTIIYRAF